LGEGKTAQDYIEGSVSRTHPNLFNGGGEVFQIDGNLGLMAAIPELLLQSHAGEIELLPALPPAWPSGRLTGLRARGGFEIDLAWRDGRMTEATIRSVGGKNAKIRYGEKIITVDLTPGQTRRLDSGLQ